MQSSLVHIFFRRSLSTFYSPLCFQFTDVLCAEPLKKKKRLDPAIIKQREERRRKRLEKQIRRLERNVQQLKPISECEIPLEIINSADLYSRNLVESGIDDSRMLSVKEWARIKTKQCNNDAAMIYRILDSQQNALDNLMRISEKLYKSAIKVDNGALPWNCKGPVETPPIQEYESPDGEYIDISRKWDHL
ncbi:mitochondrial ribosomal protein L40 [Rhodnius prolixus]|uniref:mitochondrial ribosomal protein L40 n=1 Tax=Rhodnius prolixus TaxID=13249 RepID=UPI003D18D0D1